MEWQRTSHESPENTSRISEDPLSPSTKENATVASIVALYHTQSEGEQHPTKRSTVRPTSVGGIPMTFSEVTTALTGQVLLPTVHDDHHATCRQCHFQKLQERHGKVAAHCGWAIVRCWRTPILSSTVGCQTDKWVWPHILDLAGDVLMPTRMMQQALQRQQQKAHCPTPAPPAGPAETDHETDGDGDSDGILGLAFDRPQQGLSDSSLYVFATAILLEKTFGLAFLALCRLVVPFGAAVACRARVASVPGWAGSLCGHTTSHGTLHLPSTHHASQSQHHSFSRARQKQVTWTEDDRDKTQIRKG